MCIRFCFEGSEEVGSRVRKRILPQPGMAEGISPRGTLALLRASQGYALVQGRDYVVPEDIKAVAVPVLAHRLICEEDDYRRKVSKIQSLLQTVAVPTEDWKRA